MRLSPTVVLKTLELSVPPEYSVKNRAIHCFLQSFSGTETPTALRCFMLRESVGSQLDLPKQSEQDKTPEKPSVTPFRAQLL